MVSRTQPEPAALVVVFERGGEELDRLEAINSEKALIRALNILLARSSLHIGDRLRVEAAA